jgi:hypothetical protein
MDKGNDFELPFEKAFAILWYSLNRDAKLVGDE